MKQVFVDTSGWCALADKADKYHARALQCRDETVR
jgi:predicted nucleic acid-binding protein